jgi:hypothetical protein
MLRRPTVLILGAGAGVDLDMLVGEKLSAEIADKLDIRFDDRDRLKSGHPEVTESLRRFARGREINFNEFRQAAVLIKQGVHYSGSIDSFINSHKHRKACRLRQARDHSYHIRVREGVGGLPETAERSISGRGEGPRFVAKRFVQPLDPGCVR